MLRSLLILCISILFMGCSTESDEIYTPLNAKLINNAQAFSQNAKIVFEFSQQIDPSSVSEDSFIVRDINGTKLDGMRSVLENTISFSINGNFSLNQSYSVTLTQEIKDINGISLAQNIVQIINITSTDTTSPFILGSSLDSGILSLNSKLSIQMSENLDPTTIKNTSLALFDNTNTLIAGTLSHAQGLISFVPNTKLVVDENYKLVFSGEIKDLSGNSFLASQDYFFTISMNITEGKFLKDTRVLNANMRINSAMIEGDMMYIASSDRELGIFSLLNFPSITQIASISLSSEAVDIISSGNYLFVSTLASGLLIIDSSNPASASVVSSLDTNTSIFKMHLLGNTLYMSSTANGVQVVDISNPLNPVLLSTIATADFAFDVYSLSPSLSYIADKAAGLSLVDTSQEKLIKTISTGSVARSLLVLNNLLYLANASLGVKVYDISDPLNPLLISTLSSLSYAFDLHYATNGINSYLYVADKDKGVRIFDVTNTSNIQAIAQLSTGTRIFSLLEYKSMLLALSDTGDIFLYSLFPDLIPPTILSTQPSSGEVDVLIDQNISLVFSEAVSFSNINTIASIGDESGKSISYTSSYKAQSNTLLLVPDQNLSELLVYTVSINGEVKDRLGNILENLPYRFSFTTKAPNLAPTVVSSSPTGDSTVSSVSFVVIGFSEEMDISTMISSNVELIDSTSQVYAGTVSYTNKTLTFQPSSSLFAGRTYTFRVSKSVADLSGKTLATDKVINFSISAPVNLAPTVTSTSPSQGATVTSNYGDVIINFSEDMDASSFVANSTVQSQTGVTSVSILSARQIKVVIGFVTPPQTLQVSITTGVRDSSGKNMASTFVLSYQTSGV